MEVIGHQAIGMANQIEPTQGQIEDGETGFSVDVVQENGSLGIAPGCHMIDGSRKFYAEWSGHEAKILQSDSRFKI
jgi:hypothetical protein